MQMTSGKQIIGSWGFFNHDRDAPYLSGGADVRLASSFRLVYPTPLHPDQCATGLKIKLASEHMPQYGIPTHHDT